jgi:hypothetical protein
MMTAASRRATVTGDHASAHADAGNSTTVITASRCCKL